MYNVDSYEIEAVEVDRFRLDGGAMFGSVPKTLWSKQISADEFNRIQLVCRILVVKNQSRTILIDLGMGRKWKDKEKQIYAIEYLQPPPNVISKVDDIILTHLHFDHAGGISALDNNGEAQLVFPEATVFLQEENWKHAQCPGVREKASYLLDIVHPLKQAKLQLTHNGQEIFPGIRVYQVDGHTHGLQWVLIGQGKGAVAFPADMIPTAHHVPVPYVMGYDLSAEKTMAEKEAFLNRAATEGWIVVYEHDAETSASTITKDEKGRFMVGKKMTL